MTRAPDALPDDPLARRRFLAGALAAMAGSLLPRPARAEAAAAVTSVGPRPHPDPRPGITARHVLTPAQLKKKRRDATKAYEAAREIPEVIDGLSCYCDCERTMGHRSLLSCYESQQAATCIACQEEAMIALEGHRKGRTLDEIRAAVDEAFN